MSRGVYTLSRLYFGPEFSLVDGGFDLHRIQFADEQLLSHHARALGPKASEHGFDFAVSEHGVGDVFIELPEALV